jgi:hypothetical protein
MSGYAIIAALMFGAALLTLLNHKEWERQHLLAMRRLELEDARLNVKALPSSEMEAEANVEKERSRRIAKEIELEKAKKETAIAEAEAARAASRKDELRMKLRGERGG